MKIGVLLSENDKQNELIYAFKQKGLEVSSIKAPLHFSSSDIMNILEFLHSGTYDIVHNSAGIFPLVLSSGLRTPMLTVINNYLSDEELLIIKKLPPARYFASYEASQIPGEIIGKTFAIDKTDMAGTFLSIYESILKDTEAIDRRPWGYYEVISDMKDHKVKRINVMPGKRLSLQSHRRRSEHWFVVSGKGVATLNGTDYELGEGDSIDIAKGSAHRISNPYETPLVFIEVQMGDYFGEDDIVRMEDDFGRV